jgi:putative MATE family efflux protein
MTDKASPASGVFTTGSVLRHVTVMSLTGTVGLIAIFIVDLLSLLYVSRLGNVNATAAVGYATTVMFLATSVNIGLMIGIGALVSRSLGARDREGARRQGGSFVTLSALFACAVTVLVMLVADPILSALGAVGETHAIAWRFLMITMPSNVLMAVGMGFSGVLRAVGDARRAMYVTLGGGLATAAIDPLMIFGLGLGVYGAAWATIISRVFFALMGYWGAVRVHGLAERPRLGALKSDLAPLFGIALPAILTNLATPIANGFMTGVIAPYGDDAVAANAIISRLVPVAFGALFALTGAVGPIFGQNLGARNFGRLRGTLNASLIFAGACVVFAWAVLLLAEDGLVAVFDAHGETAALLRYFCSIIAGTWAFHGALFVANAAFNNLGTPILATGFNWGKATIGTVPFAIIGSWYGGAAGAFLGQGIGAMFFGIAGVLVAYRVIARIDRAARGPAPLTDDRRAEALSEPDVARTSEPA